MMKHVSVRSSQAQVRTNPALRGLPGSLRKGVDEFMSTIQNIPFPTFQFVKPTSQPFLERQTFYPFVRPTHLRPSWLLLHDDWPPVLLDTRDEKRRNTIRIPLARAKLRNYGPILLEVYWDSQDLKLWLIDCIYFKHKNLYETETFQERVKITNMILEELLYDTSEYSDCSITMPNYLSLSDLKVMVPEPGLVVEFQPSSAGKRRFLFRQGDNKPHENRKQQQNYQQPANNKCMIINDEKEKKEEEPKQNIIKPVITQNSDASVASVVKDPKSKLPDTFRILSQTGEDYGLAAIRSMDLSIKVREALKTADSAPVEIKFYEPFQKYEILKLL